MGMAGEGDVGTGEAGMGEVFVQRATRFFVDEDGIFRGTVLPGVTTYGLEDAREFMEAQRKLAQGTPRGLVIDITAIKTMSRDVREYFMRPDHADVHRAVALIVRSPISRAIGNFFLGLNKPAMPTRLFTSEEQALTWVKTFGAGG
jgi:hypothetical protein